MHCVAYYSNSNRTCGTLKELSDNQLNRLLEAKNVREKEQLETNRHYEQCRTIPEKSQFNSSVHGIHSDPCCKLFTKILCPSKKQKLPDTSNVLERTKRQKQYISNTDLFPKTCFKCNVNRKKKKGKIVNAHKITLQSTALNLKLAAMKLNDEPQIIQFNARGTSVESAQYLMEKELMIHNACYTDYIRCLKEETECSSTNSGATGDFDAVKQFINANILNSNNAVSMIKLHSLYKTGIDNVNARSYRAKLKERILSEYGTQLIFLTINSTTPQVVVSAEGINSNTIVKNKEQIIKECAKQLRQDILQYASNYSMPSPLTTEAIADSEKTLPESVNDFISDLLKPEDHSLSDSMRRLVLSYSSDLITSVSRGKVVTLKQFLLGVGLHNITGLKTPIRILSHLGHCIDYNLVCEIGTSQAEEAMKHLENMELTETSIDTPITYWWADNFNQTLETQTGHGAIDSTHIVEFTESNLPKQVSEQISVLL